MKMNKITIIALESKHHTLPHLQLFGKCLDKYYQPYSSKVSTHSLALAAFFSITNPFCYSFSLQLGRNKRIRSIKSQQPIVMATPKNKPSRTEMGISVQYFSSFKRWTIIERIPQPTVAQKEEDAQEDVRWR